MYPNKNSRPHSLELLLTSRGRCFFNASHQGNWRHGRKTKAPVHLYHICGAKPSFLWQTFQLLVISRMMQSITKRGTQNKLLHIENENVPEERRQARKEGTENSHLLCSQQGWQVRFYHKMHVEATLLSLNDWRNCLHIGPFWEHKLSLSCWPIFHHIWQGERNIGANINGRIKWAHNCAMPCTAVIGFTNAHAIGIVKNGFTMQAAMNFDSLSGRDGHYWKWLSKCHRQICGTNSMFMKSCIAWPWILQLCCHTDFSGNTENTSAIGKFTKSMCRKVGYHAAPPEGSDSR